MNESKGRGKEKGPGVKRKEDCHEFKDDSAMAGFNRRLRTGTKDWNIAEGALKQPTG